MIRNELRHDKTSKMTMLPAKTQISLGIRPVWSESSLCARWVAKDPSFLHADSEDSDQTGRMPRLIWVFAGRTLILLVLSFRGSNDLFRQTRALIVLQYSANDNVFSHLQFSTQKLGPIQSTIWYKCFPLSFFISSPEPKAHRWAYSIGRHPSSVCRCPSSTFSNISSEVMKLILAIFNI